MSNDNVLNNAKLINTDKILVGDKCAVSNNYANSLSTKLKIVNLSSHHLVVYFRDGCIAELPPLEGGPYPDTVIIGHAKQNSLGRINAIAGMECEKTNTIRVELAKNRNKHLYYEEVIDVNSIMNSRNGIYVTTADIIIIMADRVQNIPFHPFCTQSIHNLYLIATEGFDSTTDINVGIRLINNDGLQSRVYIIFHDRLMVLWPKRSTTLKDGLYITGLTHLHTEVSNGIRKDEYFTIEEALDGKCPVKVYSNIVAARDALNASRVEEAKEVILSREHETTIINMKRQKEILENENVLLKAQQVKEKELAAESAAKREAEITAEKHRIEKELLMLKEEAALKALEQKKWTEAAKLVGTVCAVGLTIYKILK